MRIRCVDLHPATCEPGRAYGLTYVQYREYDWICPECRQSNHSRDSMRPGRYYNNGPANRRRCGHCHKRTTVVILSRPKEDGGVELRRKGVSHGA
jgi:hypothetical protein